ncbi:hypothetical protein CfE428DRAFT_4756 [Chthoniobacter flavus Ellin428]|uniref:Uncharacterized protein n=2 Tax=Chthoniobacter flavus TaxID=191863 RepID=B4D766_9BACT|nr:hypothetical protein CfE428DRAFT_4756 [Chthoniobacter flavus Ellin428]
MAAMKRFLPLLFAPVLVLAQDSDLKSNGSTRLSTSSLPQGPGSKNSPKGFHWSEGPGVEGRLAVFFPMCRKNKLYRWAAG